MHALVFSFIEWFKRWLSLFNHFTSARVFGKKYQKTTKHTDMVVQSWTISLTIVFSIRTLEFYVDKTKDMRQAEIFHFLIAC